MGTRFRQIGAIILNRSPRREIRPSARNVHSMMQWNNGIIAPGVEIIKITAFQIADTRCQSGLPSPAKVSWMPENGTDGRLIIENRPWAGWSSLL